MAKTKRTPAPSKRSSEQRDTLGSHKQRSRREMAERMRRPRNAREAARLLGD